MRSPQHAAWNIEKLHPAEYASHWGTDQSADGCLFYNCSDSDHGKVIANPDWTAADWRKFGAAVQRQILEVLKAVKSGTKNRTGWTAKDIRNLQRLREWTEYMAGRMESNNQWNLSRTM